LPTLARSLPTLLLAAPLALVGYGLWLGADPGTGAARTLRLGHGLSRDHPVHRGLEFMAAEVARRSAGALRVEIYPDEQLGPERNLIELLQIGSLAMTKVSTAPLESFSPRFKVFALPYLFRSRRHFWDVLDGSIGAELLEASLPYRIVGLAFYDAGARSFYVNRRVDRPIRRPADLEGLSIRVQRSRSAVRLIELFGAKPVPIPFGELYTALDTGTVDGAENNPPSLYSTRQYEVTSYYSLNEHTFVPDILIMSVDTWQRLSAVEREWIEGAAHASSLQQRIYWEESVEESLRVMREAGLEVLEDVDREAFAAAARPMYDDPEFQAPEMRALIERIRSAGSAAAEQP
jgi:tripartite ATP-independent transporter DctP family solute receptor